MSSLNLDEFLIDSLIDDVQKACVIVIHQAIDESTTCQLELKRGKRAHEKCGKKAKDGRCKMHTKSDDGCECLITRGSRKNESCGKPKVKGCDFCSIHKKKNSSASEIEEQHSESESEADLYDCATCGKKRSISMGGTCVLCDKTAEMEARSREASDDEKEDPKTCQFEMKRGKRIGELCGKKCSGEYCNSHANK